MCQGRVPVEGVRHHVEVGGRRRSLSISCARKARFLTRWEQHAVAQRRLLRGSDAGQTSGVEEIPLPILNKLPVLLPMSRKGSLGL